MSTKLIQELAMKIVTHYYETEQTHYEDLRATFNELDYEEGELDNPAFETPQDHIFLTLLKLETELYKNQ